MHLVGSASTTSTTSTTPLSREAYKLMCNGERQRDAEGYRLRAAGVCIRGLGKDLEVLLVTTVKSSGSKDPSQLPPPRKWVVPGGGVEKDEDASAAAVRELEEEAGVRAETGTQIGVFADHERKHRTTVFVMDVKEELPVWEDNIQIGRERAWMNVDEAIACVKDRHITILLAAKDLLSKQ